MTTTDLPQRIIDVVRDRYDDDELFRTFRQSGGNNYVQFAYEYQNETRRRVAEMIDAEEREVWSIAQQMMMTTDGKLKFRFRTYEEWQEWRNQK